MSASDYLSHFTLWGDFNIDDVSSQMGIEPSAAYPKGETSLLGTPALISTWDLHCPANIATSEEQIEYLLAALWPHANALRPLSGRFQAHLCISGGADLCLRPPTLQKLADLNLTLDFFNHKGEPSIKDEVSA